MKLVPLLIIALLLNAAPFSAALAVTANEGTSKIIVWEEVGPLAAPQALVDIVGKSSDLSWQSRNTVYAEADLSMEQRRRERDAKRRQLQEEQRQDEQTLNGMTNPKGTPATTAKKPMARYVIFENPVSRNSDAEYYLLTVPYLVYFEEGDRVFFAPLDLKKDAYRSMERTGVKFYEPEIHEHIFRTAQEANDFVDNWYYTKTREKQHTDPQKIYIIDAKSGSVQKRYTISSRPRPKRTGGAGAAR